MQSPFNGKLADRYPYKPSQTCVDYEDYDPCESSEDITEKDLAVLLKEEAAKLEREKMNIQATEAESDKKEKPLSGAYDKQTNDADFAQEDKNGAKKKSCKYIKNPFFTNRLEMATTHLPLPPPQPPSQNFPPAKDESSTRICPEKKKCKKDNKDRKPAYTVSDYNGDVETKENENDELDETDENLSEGKSNNEGKIRRYHEDKEVSRDQGKGKRNGKNTDKKLCKKKTIEKGPTCKKKELDKVINFQPWNITYQQNDLPETSPKDIPEVKHQILMAYGENKEDDCKKKCKKKTKTKG